MSETRSKSVSMRPAVIVSRLPRGVSFGRVPLAAQALINICLSKREAALMIYYMSVPSGFAPSAHEVYLHTNIDYSDLKKIRRSLHEQGFISYHKGRNTITVNWDYILGLGRVAMMLQENDGCNVREVLKSGVYYGRHSRDGAKRYAYGAFKGTEFRMFNEHEFEIWLNDPASVRLADVYDKMGKRTFGYTGKELEGLKDEELAVIGLNEAQWGEENKPKETVNQEEINNG